MHQSLKKRNQSFKQNQSSKLQDDIFKFVKNELRKLDIKIKQNEIEIVLSYFNFDQEKTINSFKNDEAKNIFSEWTITKKKKNVQLHSKTSTPIKYLHNLNLTKNDSNSKTISQKNSKTEDSYLLHEKQVTLVDATHLTLD